MPSQATPGGGRGPRFDRAWVIAVAGSVLALLAAWRCTLGMTFVDDGYYAAATLRLAQGARLFIDEMYVQSLGFLAAVPFAKVWIVLFGTTGFVVALRLFYVAIAVVVAVFIYRILRPSFGRWPSLAGAAVPLLAPAYSLLAVSYDTMATIGMLLALVLAFKALRDSSRTSAALAGAAAVFASISYPPLALVAIAMLIAFAILGRDRRLTATVVVGGAVTGGAFVAGLLLSGVTIEDIRRTWSYVAGAYSTAGPGGRLASQAGRVLTLFTRSWGVPLWAWLVPALALSVAAAILAVRRPESQRLRALVLAALPVALAIPVLANWLSLGGGASLQTLGSNYLIGFVLLTLPGIVVSLRGGSGETYRLLRLALPAGIVGFVIVTVSTSASPDWGSGVVGLAPLALASVVWWVAEVRRLSPGRLKAVAAGVLLAAFVVLLFGTTFKDDAPLTLHHTITSGSYAGVTTSDGQAARVSAVEGLTGRWVGPETGVFFYQEPATYLLQRGIAVSNATWPDTGRADQATIDYFSRIGRWPDVAFVPSRLITPLGTPSVPPGSDPLLSALLARYTVSETDAATGLTVLSRTPTATP